MGVRSRTVAELNLVCCCALEGMGGQGLSFNLTLACRFCSRSEVNASVHPAFGDGHDGVNGASTSNLSDDESDGTIYDPVGSFSNCYIRYHHYKVYGSSDHLPSRQLCSHLH